MSPTMDYSEQAARVTRLRVPLLELLLAQHRLSTETAALLQRLVVARYYRSATSPVMVADHG